MAYQKPLVKAVIESILSAADDGAQTAQIL